MVSPRMKLAFWRFFWFVLFFIFIAGAQYMLTLHYLRFCWIVLCVAMLEWATRKRETMATLDYDATIFPDEYAAPVAMTRDETRAPNR